MSWNIDWGLISIVDVSDADDWIVVLDGGVALMSVFLCGGVMSLVLVGCKDSLSLLLPSCSSSEFSMLHTVCSCFTFVLGLVTGGRFLS